MAQVRASLPEGVSDLRAHCLAAGAIAMSCSVGEAWLAGWGKELQDLLGSGDASRADLRANAAGRRCSQNSGESLKRCCESAGY